MDPNQLFLIFVIAGLFLMGLEIFVPGGVLGLLGGLCLLIAIIVGFVAFGAEKGTLAALSILVFLGISITFWMTVIPKTRFGQTLTLSTDTAGYKSAKVSLRDMLGKQGVALTPLGPSGLIKIEGQRLDAIAEGKWIDQGAAIKVVSVVGNHLTVREIVTPQPEPQSEAAA
jgi:membrane-bound ClpP family serine protease